nr:MAG TPA: hypothetical protein [Caudoviricetes sp.]
MIWNKILLPILNKLVPQWCHELIKKQKTPLG